jgi:hypothetical protein
VRRERGREGGMARLTYCLATMKEREGGREGGKEEQITLLTNFFYLSSSQQATYVASGSYDQSTVVWNMQTGQVGRNGGRERKSGYISIK